MSHRTMGRVDTRIPDEEEELLQKIADSENYQSRSELVREAIREMINRKVEREELREVKKRIEEVKRGEVELVDDEEVMEKAGLE
jgi:Arc/MetJ-type ribon-helix-helix transcriptional regulator